MDVDIETIKKFNSLVKTMPEYGFKLEIDIYPKPFGNDKFCLYVTDSQPASMSRTAPFAVFDTLLQVSGFLKGLEVQQIVQNCEKHKPRNKTKKVKQ